MATRTDDLRAGNEAVLLRMAESGVDFSKAHLVDFTIVFVDQPSAVAFSKSAEAMDYAVDVNESATVASHPWDVTATRPMLLSVGEITDAEIGLSDLAKKLGGDMDGWGCLVPA